MTSVTTTIQQDAEGVFIWVGPRDSAILSTFNFSNYKRVFLIAVDKLHQTNLLQLRQTDTKIIFLQQAVAFEDGSAQLYRYNLNQFNALQPATGLLELYPGLQLQERTNVQAVSFARLVCEQQLESSKNNTLVLSLPVQALALLQSLADKQLLVLFSQLIVQMGVNELYQGAGTCEELESWLLQQGYLPFDTDRSDPDLPVISFRRHALLDKVDELAAANNQLIAQLTSSQVEQQELRQQLKLQSQQSIETAELLEREHAALEKSTHVNAALAEELAQIKELHGAELQALQEKLQQAEQVLVTGQQVADAMQLQQQIQSLEDRLQLTSAENAEFLLTIQSLIEQKTQVEKNTIELQQKLKQLDMQAIEAERISAIDADHIEQQLQKLETTLQAVSCNNIELLANNENLKEQKSQSDNAVLELQQKLSQAEQLASKDRESAKAETAQLKGTLQACEQQLQEAKDYINGLVATVESLQNQKTSADKTATEMRQLLEKHKADLTILTKHAAIRLDKINKLESTVRRQQTENQQLSARQQALQQEMLKAEAQIDLIKELILKE